MVKYLDFERSRGEDGKKDASLPPGNDGGPAARNAGAPKGSDGPRSGPPASSRGSPPEPTVTKRRAVSIVWLIPAVAGAIALWLGWVALQERGPTISIQFQTAEGLEPGKTKVRYRDVDVGEVSNVEIADDLSHVVVTADMRNDADQHLREDTNFWVVRPRIGVGGISGLGTLLGGSYIAMDPVPNSDAASRDEFVGLEVPPPLTLNEPGRRFVLRSSRSASVSDGSPVYYRGILAGTVLDARLADDKLGMWIDIFIKEEHADLVRDSSLFWSASGFTVDLGPNGMEVDVASIQALLAGGVAFRTPDIDEPGEPSAEGQEFVLHPSRRDANEAQFVEKEHYIVYFNGSVRGLQVGSPVEFRGIQVGSVSRIQLEYDIDDEIPRIRTDLTLEPGRWALVDSEGNVVANDAPTAADDIEGLVENGVRVQLDTGNLLTGEKIVRIDFFPDAQPAAVTYVDGVPVIPSIPTQLDTIANALQNAANKLNEVPIAELFEDLRSTVQAAEALITSADTQQLTGDARAAVADLRAVMAGIESNLDPLANSLITTTGNADAALIEARAAMASINQMTRSDSQLQGDLTRMLREITSAARSLRALTDYLERNPDSLLRGKRP